MADEILKCQRCDFEAETYTRLAYHVKEQHGDTEEATGQLVSQPPNEIEDIDGESQAKESQVESQPEESQVESQAEESQVESQPEESQVELLPEESETHNQTDLNSIMNVKIKEEKIDEDEATFESSVSLSEDKMEVDEPDNENKGKKSADLSDSVLKHLLTPTVLIVPKVKITPSSQTSAAVSDSVKHGKAFICYICNLSFSKKDRLAAHISYVHGGEKLYQCHECQERFTWRDTYRKHLHQVHNINTIHCDACDFSCSTRAALIKHKQIHKKTTSYHRCGTCSKVFASESLLKDHKKCHEQKSTVIKDDPDGEKTQPKTVKPTTRIKMTRVTCETCNLQFKLRKYYNRHNRLVHGIYIRPPSKLLASKNESESNTEKPTVYVCHICKKQYTHYKAFWYHKRKVHNIFAHHENAKQQSSNTPVSLTCSVCNVSFANSGNLMRHYRNIHNNTEFKKSDKESNQAAKSQATSSEPQCFPCDLCDRTFERQSYMNIHKAKSHPGEHRKNLRCKECGRQFAKLHHLQCHEKWHKKARNKPFKCKMCERGFFKKVDLIRHSQVHKNDKTYTCNVCQQKCSSLSAMLIHKKSHQQAKGSPENSCQVCGEVFHSRSAKILHVKSHPNVLNCDVCSYATMDDKSLKTHYQKHINPKNKMIKCTYRSCNYSCKTAEGIKAHIATHFNGSYFACEMCEFRTKYRPNLFRHIEAVHKKKSDGAKSPAEVGSPNEKEGESPVKKSPMQKLVLRLKTLHHKKINSTTAKVSEEEEEEDDINDASELPMKKCRVCFKEFKYAAELRRHEWIHTDDKPYVCNHCWKGFIHKDKLKSHHCQPVGEKGFKCMYCNEYFDSRTQLSLHQVTHRQTDVRVKCSLCDETFRSRVDLASHQYTTHNVEAQPKRETGGYTCGHCQRPFKLWRNMKVHIEKPGPCKGVTPVPNSASAHQQISSSGGSRAHSTTETDSRETYSNSYCGSSPLDLSVNDDNSKDAGMVITNVCSLTSDNDRRSPSSSRLHSLLLTKSSTPENRERNRSGHDAASNGTDEGFSEKSHSDTKSQSEVTGLTTPKQRDRFKCKHCEITFPDVMLFTIHMGIHGSDYPFQCSNCGENCGDRNAFMLHFIGQHS
ncbi:zinc finger protein 493-like [Ptychodera flava]|uniref:zinc finger protein 493-like n=1 Tax=Ptychodera flava TaxID=63121 RepID=UPI003969F721